MKLFDYIDKALFEEMVKKGYININYHPSFPLRILNYSKSCNFDRVWNDVTEKCRGLIVDDEDNIIAKPFKKFYNYEEIEDKNTIPDTLFEVYDKMDGSLGILYWWDDVPYITTKGNFESEQGIHATEIIQKKWKLGQLKHLDRNYTYLFEIVYPGDPHIVHYGNIDNIFLIAILHNENDWELDIDNFRNIFRVTKKFYGIGDWREIRDIFKYEGQEGFVVKFSNGYRLKLKYAEYFQLHFLKHGFTENKIFEYLKNGDLDIINESLSIFDEEQKMIYQSIIDKYNNWYKDIVDLCEEEYRDEFETDKEAAEYFKTCTYPFVMFAMRKGMNIDKFIWKIIDKQR